MKCQYCGNLGNTIEGEPCKTCGAPIVFKQDPIESGGVIQETGGFLIPPYISVERHGVRAAIWRFIGNHLHRDDWYEKGMDSIYVADQIIKKLAEIIAAEEKVNA